MCVKHRTKHTEERVSVCVKLWNDEKQQMRAKTFLDRKNIGLSIFVFSLWQWFLKLCWSKVTRNIRLVPKKIWFSRSRVELKNILFKQALQVILMQAVWTKFPETLVSVIWRVWYPCGQGPCLVYLYSSSVKLDAFNQEILFLRRVLCAYLCCKELSIRQMELWLLG